jgi:hypothetical protein
MNEVESSHRKTPTIPQLPRITPLAEILQDVQSQEFASEYYKCLVDYIELFDSNLDQEHEVGIRLVNFGQTLQFSVQNIGYYNPKLISFYGELEDGSSVQLIQNVNQISFLLLAVKRKHPEKPKRKIGFLTNIQVAAAKE